MGSGSGPLELCRRNNANDASLSVEDRHWRDRRVVGAWSLRRGSGTLH